MYRELILQIFKRGRGCFELRKLGQVVWRGWFLSQVLKNELDLERKEGEELRVMGGGKGWVKQWFYSKTFLYILGVGKDWDICSRGCGQIRVEDKVLKVGWGQSLDSSKCQSRNEDYGFQELEVIKDVRKKKVKFQKDDFQ